MLSNLKQPELPPPELGLDTTRDTCLNTPHKLLRLRKKKIKEDLRKPPTSLLHKRNPLTLKNSSITITTKTCPQLLVIHHMYKISSNLEARRTNPQNPPPSPTHNSPNKHNHSIIRKASLRHQPNANRRSYLNTAPRTL